MKILFCLILTGSALFVRAQNNAIRVVPKKQHSVKETSEWMDTTNSYASKYGNVAKLTFDNMPCILPYNNTTKIPNTAKGKQAPSEIPNAWKRKPVKPKSNVSPVWPKDSTTFKIMPWHKK